MNLTDEIANLPFGTKWADAVQDRSDCVSWVGDYDDLFAIRNWAFACTSKRDGGNVTKYAYLLGESGEPTLERARYVVIPPPNALVEDWTRLESALLDSLTRPLEIASWRDRDTERIGMGGDRVIEARLFIAYPDTGIRASPNFKILSFKMADTLSSYGHGKPGAPLERLIPIGGSPQPPEPPAPPRRTRTVVESLVVYCFSRDLEEETREAEWDLDKDTSAVSMSPASHYGAAEVIRALKVKQPFLASVVESTRTSSDQIRGVNSAVSIAHRLRAGEERDLILYAAHLWANRAVGKLQGNPLSDCNGTNSAFVREFNATFSARDRSEIQCDREGAWWYSGGFIDSVVPHAGTNRWADYAFLDRTAAGWNLDYPCSSDSAVGSDEFRPVIARGEAFLKAHPSSVVVPEVRLFVAEAHETAWSLAKFFTGDTEVVEKRYLPNGPTHRSRAIALYERQLRDRPGDSRNPEIRRRLARMRLDVDTGYRQFWCTNE